MRRRAFGIAETLIASAMIAMVIMGLYAISAASARAAQTQSQRVTATALAEESLDLVRFERERFWRGQVGSANPGRSADGFWTYLSGLTGAVTTGSQISWTAATMPQGWVGQSTVSGFDRTLTISKDTAALQGNLSYTDPSTGAATLLDAAKATESASSLLKVTVTVSWAGATGTDSYSLTSYLTDWLEGML